MKKYTKSIYNIKLVTYLFLIISLLSIFHFDPIKNGIYADMSTHLLQSQSIAYDLDLKYEKKDLDRYYSEPWETPPMGIFLVKSDSNYIYGKPFLYSLFSAPFTRIFNSKGPLILNALCLSVIFFLILKAVNTKTTNIVTAIIFSLVLIICSTLPFYIPTIHPDIFIATLIFLSFYLLIYGKQKKYIFLSSVLFGLSIYEKLPFGIFAPVYTYITFKKTNLKKTIFYLAICALTYTIPTLITATQTHTFSSYKGERWYYTIPPFDTKPEKGRPVDTNSYFNINKLINTSLPTIYNLKQYAVDFIIGKQTGILIYFPCTIPLLFGTIVLNKKTRNILILPTSIAYILFYFVLLPQNYYGGLDSLGNRYFLQIYPLITITLVSMLRKGNKNTLLIISTALLSVTVYSYFFTDPNAQIKTHQLFIQNNKLIRQLPTELTLLPALSTAKIDINKDIDIYLINSYGIENDTSFWIPGNNQCSELYIVNKNIDTKNQKLSLSLHSGPHPNVLAYNNKTKNIPPNKEEIITLEIKEKSAIFLDNQKVNISKSTICASMGYTYPNDSRNLGIYVKSIEVQ